MKLSVSWSSIGWRVRALFLVFVALAATIFYARWDAQRSLDVPVKHTVDPVTPRGSKALVVFAHGYAYGKKPLEGLIREVRQARPDADILIFEYASQRFSNADPFRIAAQMEERIRAVADERQYEHIYLVGYSMGALLLRKAYIYASGSIEDLPYAGSESTTRQPLGWPKHVDRIVLLAGMNRGWSLDDPPKEMTLWKLGIYRLGLLIGKISGTGMLIRQLERGQPFVANLRLQWLSVMRNFADPRLGMRQPVVVQFLGDKDDVVSSDDNRDVKVAKNFIWVGLGNTTHANVMDIDEPENGLYRRRRILQAFGTDSDIQALARAMPRSAREEDAMVTTVVFVLHGIRDMGKWTGDLEVPLQARFQRDHEDTGDKIHVHSAGYGYFAMGPFLLLPDRQRNVRWFMDEVTELKARFPNMQRFHFIGHSNGTYVLASALQRYKTLIVDHVVFAGSVVPRDYPWKTLSGRVGLLRNYVSADDVVVALFPRLFELALFRLLNPDIGSAGFNGFQDGQFKSLETQFVHGGHSAALHYSNVASIVEFIATGKRVDAQDLLVPTQLTYLQYFSQLCWIVWLGLLLGLVLVGWALVRIARWARGQFAPRHALSPGRVTGVVIVAYCGVVWMTLNTL